MEQIGKYRLEEEIGRGGFGRVYRAFDPTVGRRVAIKVLLAEGDQDLLTRFRNEANATGKLHHKNIVTIHDYGEFEGTPYLVMEYLEGEDLQRVIAAGRRLSLLEKITIMTQAAEGLHHAHLKGIVHRDVKPANMMLLTDHTVKVMDFGIARLVRERATRLTQTGNLIGTISHMAPEQFRGSDVDQLCDIFAYGLVYYELLTSRHPFKGNDPATTIYAITSRDPEPISRAAPDCPAALEQIVMRTLHKDREMRYQSLEDLLFDIAPIRLQLQSDAAQDLVRKAERSFNESRIEEARSLVREVLQLDPNNTAARRLREAIQRAAQMRVARERSSQLIATGRQELATQNYAKAIEHFESALKLDTGNTEAARLLEDARTAAQRAERASSLLAQARREFDAQNLTNAYRDVAECLQLAPENEAAATLLGSIRKEIERRERDRRIKESIVRIEALAASASYDEAVARLADLEAAYPGTPQIKPLIAGIQTAKLEHERKQRLAQGVAAARQLISERRWAEAVAALEPLDRQFPAEQNITALLAYSREELRVQQKAEAIERLIQEARGAVEHLEFDRAESILSGGLRAYPGEPSVEAFRHRTRAARIEHERTSGVKKARARAEELLHQSRFDEAIAELDKAISSLDAVELLELRYRANEDRQVHERAERLSKAVTAARESLEQDRLEDAVEAARAGRLEFPEESNFGTLLSEAERRLKERKKAERIADAIRFGLECAGKLEFDRALQLLDEAIRECGPDPSLVALKSQIEVERDQHQRTESITTALAEARKQSDAGRIDDAIGTLERVCEAYAGERTIEERLTELRKERKRKAEVEELVRNAGGLLDRREYGGAIETALRGLEQYPEEPRLRNILDEARQQRAAFDRERALQVARERVEKLLGEGRLPAAAQALEQALRKLPGEIELQRMLAAVQSDIERQELEAAVSESKGLLDRGKLDEAANALKNHQARFPNAGELRALFSYANELLRARDRADEIDAAAREGQNLLDREMLEQAAALVGTAAAKYPDEVRLSTLLEKVNGAIAGREKRQAIEQILQESDAFLRKQKYTEALRVLDRGLDRFPSESALVQARSAALSTQKTAEIRRTLESARSAAAKLQFADAIGILERGLVRFPDEPEILAALEAVRSELTEHERGRRVANAMRGAEAALSKNQTERALEIVSAALLELPDDPDLLRMRELAENRQRQLELARKRKDELQQLRGLTKAANSASDSAKLDEIRTTASTLLGSHESDPEFQDAASSVRHAVAAREESLKVSISDVREAIVSREPSAVSSADPQKVRLKRALALAGAGLAVAIAIVGGVLLVKREGPRTPPGTESIPRPAAAAAKIVRFYATQPVIRAGEAVQLCYGVLNARSVRLEPAVAPVEALPNHCLELKPKATAEYKLTAVGEDGAEASESVRVVVQDAPVAIGTLLVETQLDGVAVLINGRKHGRLTESGQVQIPLDVNDYVIGVEKPGFESPEPRRVKLSKDQTRRIQFRLQPKPALLAIRGGPAGVQVLLDGKPLGVLQGDAQFQIPPGAHVIEFAKDRRPFKRLPLQFEPGSQVDLTRQDIGAPEIPKPALPEPAPDPKIIEARQWEQIRNAADPAVFEQFARNYPNGQYAAAARQKIEQLQWDAARTGRNPAVLQAFANRFPSSPHREEAMRLIEQLEWERVNRDDENSVRAYLNRFPNSQQAQTELTRLEQLQRQKADAQAIASVLAQFSKAYETKDPAQVARIWPGIPKPTMDTIRKVFNEARSITMRIQAADVQVSGDLAVVKGQRTSRTVYDRRKEAQDITDSVLIQLRRSGSGWVIQSIN